MKCTINAIIITPCSCTKGKVICCVIIVAVNTKIAKSQDVDVLVGGQWYQDVINGKKVTSVCF